jgi:hypothetical protein
MPRTSRINNFWSFIRNVLHNTMFSGDFTDTIAHSLKAVSSYLDGWALIRICRVCVL